jgi:hypothetical protein
VLALLLVVGMSTAQVCHSHRATLPAESSQSGQHREVPAPDHCLLCVAMHSALPTSLQGVQEPVLQVREFASAASDAPSHVAWRFEMATRPPPGKPARS